MLCPWQSHHASSGDGKDVRMESKCQMDLTLNGGIWSNILPLLLFYVKRDRLKEVFVVNELFLPPQHVHHYFMNRTPFSAFIFPSRIT
jgi:hypothetical protein